MKGWIACALALTLGCFGKSTEFDRARANAQKAEAEESPDAGPSALPSLAGTPLGGMGELLMAQLDKPGPFDELRESPGFDDGAPHFAVIDLGGPVVEMQSVSWFSPPKGVELRVVAKRLRELGQNSQVKGAFVRFLELPISAAMAQDLRSLLAEFRADGARKLYCYTESASTQTYYVMSACDEIAMPKNGSLFFGGVAATPIHIRGLLDRFGVRPDFVTVGSYKGAAEALTRDAPSPQMVETLNGILDTAYATMVADVATDRKLSPAQVRAAIDRALFTADSAREAHLVDEVSSFSGFRDARLAESGWRHERWQDKSDTGLGQVMRFLGMGWARPMGSRIAVVYAVGNIVDGKGEGILGARGEIASGTLVPALRALGRDDGVEAVVLRIDSPGGSALASELIAEAVAEVKSRKPVVVSMGSVAASGGYYIAAGANKIFAQDNTLTGSIGVVGGKLVFGQTMARYGVRAYPMSRGKNAHLFSILEPWTGQERAAVLATMEKVYEVFVDRVAAGRKLSREQVLAVAQGRVWTGAVASSNGLVDAIGGLDAALAEARQLAGVGVDTAVEIYPPEPTLRDILVSFGQVRAPFGLSASTELLGELGLVEGRVVAGLVDQVLLLRETRILAAAFLPFSVH